MTPTHEDFTPIQEDETVLHFPIRPKDLPERSHHFGNYHIEVVAGRLVQFFKSRGRWCGFTLEELRTFSIEQGWDPNQMLYGLVGAWRHVGEEETDPAPTWYPVEIFLVADGNHFYVTDRFIERYAGRKLPQRVPGERRTFRQDPSDRDAEH